MTRKIIMIGGGGHAKVLAQAAASSGKRIEGYLDSKIDSFLKSDLPHLGEDKWLEDQEPEDLLLLNGLGLTSRGKPRISTYTYWSSRGFVFENIIHKFSCIAPNVITSQGLQVMAGAVIQPDVLIKENVTINTSSVIEHGCELGANSFIAPKACLCGGVKIGENVVIGAGATILPNIHISDNEIIPPGSVIKYGI